MLVYAASFIEYLSGAYGVRAERVCVCLCVPAERRRFMANSLRHAARPFHPHVAASVRTIQEMYIHINVYTCIQHIFMLFGPDTGARSCRKYQNVNEESHFLYLQSVH